MTTIENRSHVPEPFPGNGERDGSPVPTPYVGNGEHLFYDVAAMLEGGIPDPPAPAVVRRTDGHCIFYAGQVNIVFGDPESGKTMLASAGAADILARGGRVLFLDMDHNGPEAIVSRLLDLGAPEDALRDRAYFRYVEPDDAAHLLAAVGAAVTWRPAVAIVDSVGELLPILGYSSNSPDDFTAANSAVLKPLAKSGAAVVGIDHLAKNTESRAAGPTGTAAKKRAVGGVSIRVTIKSAFTPGKGGSASLTIHKDRHGGLRRNCPPPDGGEAYAGTFVLEDVDGELSWHVTAPQQGDRAPSNASESDLAALDRLIPPPASVRDVKARLGWRSDRAAEALREWRAQGGEQRSPVPDTGVGNGEQGGEAA